MHTVKKADYISDYKIKLVFDDNSVKSFDMSPYLENDSLIFRPLKQKYLFKMFEVQWGTITWITWADVSPDFLYNNWTLIK